MGLIARAIRVIRAKFNKYLSRAENPVDQLELTYQDMREERRSMKKSIVNVKAQRKSLERKIERFEEEVSEHNQQARAAMEEGEEDLARTAIEQKQAKVRAVEDLTEQVANIEDVEEDMYEKLDEIDNRLSELKTKKEILKARYEGAEAMKDINESLSGEIGEHSVEEVVDNIHEEINEMQSRAEAVQEFEEEREEQDVEAQLDEISVNQEVEQEMDTLRQELTEDDVEVEQVAEQHEMSTEKLEEQLD